MTCIARRAFLASVAAVAMPVAASRPFTPEAWGGDLNAAIAALPDGGVIEGGKWWVRGRVEFVGRNKTLRNLRVVIRPGTSVRAGVIMRHHVPSAAWKWKA